jgi:regulation of enolase protein 1 (concanavalin A-like superfamily)
MRFGEPGASRTRLSVRLAAVLPQQIDIGRCRQFSLGFDMSTAIFARHDGVWLNEPKRWTAQGDSLELVTDKATDFWQKTHYGFCRDSGHFLGFRTAEAFTAELRIQGDFRDLYDQAGIMVRLDAEHWVKAGIEFSDGRPMLSSVLTIGQSDWATAPYEHDADDFWMRVTVADGVLRLQTSADGRTWPLVRLAPFTKAQSYLVGPMACTPERAGLRVTFTTFSLTPPLGKDLHDLS